MYRKLMAAMLLASGAVCAAPVQPFNLTEGEAGFVKGQDHYYPVRIERTAPRLAVTEGGMWLPQPDGGRVFARSVRLIEQGDGIQTWIGKVALPGGERSVVLTVGPDAAFGSLLTADGKPFRLVTRAGKTYLVQEDAAAARLSAGSTLLHPRGEDYRVAPSEPRTGYAAPQTLTKQSLTTAAAASSATVDVLLGYTPGMLSRLGSTSAVVTRLNYLVALANQAYADSKVNHRIRLVGTMAVDYSDTGPNSQVLDDLTNASPSGPLAALRARRTAVGADLVSLIRPYSDAGQGGFCGLAYLIGAGETPITAQSAAYGYSTLGDGADPGSGAHCQDNNLAHELGHNMGLAHDKANAPQPGAFSYAYGWRRTLDSGSFSTIMAYSTGGQERLPYFANPDITLCNGNRCGDPTTANQALALNQTMPEVASFMVAGHPAVDINNDGQADILLQSDAAYTSLMETSDFRPATKTHAVTAGYRIAATGDLNGDGRTDLVWTNAAGTVYFWLGAGNDSYTSQRGPDADPGAHLVGTGDLDGDGDADLLWFDSSTSQFSYWLMDGATVATTRSYAITPGYTIAAIGDFNGDARADIAWTSAARDLYIWSSTQAGGFSSKRSLSYPAGWRVVGSGDMNGDQRADLVWLNDAGHQFAYWLMDGSTRVGYRVISVAPGYSIAAIDRFSGNTDGILWTSAARDMYVWANNGSGGFTSRKIAAYPDGNGGYLDNYPSGWSVVSNLPANP